MALREKLDEEMKQYNYGRSTTKRIIDYQREYLLAQLEVVMGIYKYDNCTVSNKRWCSKKRQIKWKNVHKVNKEKKIKLYINI